VLLGEEKSIFPVFCPEISEPQESSVRGCVGCFVWRLSPAPVVRGKRPHGMAECEHSDRRTRMPRCCSCARSSILRELTYLLPRSSSSARRPHGGCKQRQGGHGHFQLFHRAARKLVEEAPHCLAREAATFLFTVHSVFAFCDVF